MRWMTKIRFNQITQPPFIPSKTTFDRLFQMIKLRKEKSFILLWIDSNQSLWHEPFKKLLASCGVQYSGNKQTLWHQTVGWASRDMAFIRQPTSCHERPLHSSGNSTVARLGCWRFHSMSLSWMALQSKRELHAYSANYYSSYSSQGVCKIVSMSGTVWANLGGAWRT